MHRTSLLLIIALAVACSVIAACDASGSTPSAPPGQIMIDATARISAISPDQLGANLGIWYDVTTPSLKTELARIGPHLLRWPGGSIADVYHWQQHLQCNGKIREPAYHPRSTFSNLMSDLIIPGGYDIAITVPYGTNATCASGGDPKEAAAWVRFAKANGYGSRVKFWTVGNESFGNWETDMHAEPHDPETYAAAMSGSSGYYALMKAADPEAQVGIVVTGNGLSDAWDSFVLSHAPYDFVELHWYPQAPGKENDDYLLYDAPADFSNRINAVKDELTEVGKAGTPIMVGELNSVAYNPGKQTVSIVNALFAGQVLAEGLKNGLATEVWWFGDGGTQNCGNNDSPSLYGFQSWGSYDLVFGNTAYSYNSCSKGPIVPEGTVSPSGEAFKLVSGFAGPGEYMLSTASGSPDVRAYAATQRTGYALLLFNLSETAAANVRVTISHAHISSYTATDAIYGKAQYDQSRSNVWPGTLIRNLGAVGNTFPVTLPPWSMSLVRLHR